MGQGSVCGLGFVWRSYLECRSSAALGEQRLGVRAAESRSPLHKEEGFQSQVGFQVEKDNLRPNRVWGEKQGAVGGLRCFVGEQGVEEQPGLQTSRLVGAAGCYSRLLRNILFKKGPALQK